MSRNTLIQDSKRGWTASGSSEPTTEQIALGCQQRIAQSLESIEKTIIKVVDQSEAEYLRNRCRRLENQVERLNSENRTLRGWSTRHKNTIKQLESILKDQIEE